MYKKHEYKQYINKNVLFCCYIKITSDTNTKCCFKTFISEYFNLQLSGPNGLEIVMTALEMKIRNYYL